MNVETTRRFMVLGVVVQVFMIKGRSRLSTMGVNDYQVVLSRLCPKEQQNNNKTRTTRQRQWQRRDG